jgi:hypothetical protein
MHQSDAISGLTKNGNKVLVMCSEVEAGNFTFLVHSVLLNVGESVLKLTETSWKNSLILEKDA